ncbi:MAG: transcriptional repressor LexA [Candidatus Obscuribacterales bacterium]|nr:transcriptional repressor LexA [Candidatus Obscuribacterales bacterium]
MNITEQLPPRQGEVLKLITSLTEQQGYPPTLAELAQAMGLRNRMTVHQHVAALKKKGLVQWEPGLNRSLRVIGGSSEPISINSKRQSKPASVMPITKGLPMAGTIAAGNPIDALETDEYLEVESRYAGSGCFALKVKGESMIEEGIFDGDFVIVKPNPSPTNGEIVVAVLDDDTATLKRFYKEKGRYRLQPANKDMEPIYVPSTQEMNIKGVVVGLFRKMS